MKKLLLLPVIAVAFIATPAFTQSNPGSTLTALGNAFTHYHISPIIINPAFAGFDEVHGIQMNIRNQWTGFEGAPKTYGIGYAGPMSKTLGLGINFLAEDIGSQSIFRFQLNYAFRFQLRNVKLAAGFSTDFFTVKEARSVYDNPLYDPGDLKVEDAVDGNRIFDASFGLVSSFSDNTYAGLTLGNLVVAKIGEIGSSETKSDLFRSIILYFGHKFQIEPYNFTLEPSLRVQRLNHQPFHADFNLKGSFINDRIIAGLSYRAGVGGGVGLLLGTNVDVFKLYYSYDISFQEVQQYNNGTHEVTIAFQFGNNRNRFDHSSMQ